MSLPLIEAVSNYIDSKEGGDGIFTTPIDGLGLFRSSQESVPNHMIYKPALCIVVQGGKQVLFGDRVFNFGEMQSLVVSIELPAFGRVTHASAERPYLGINIDLDVGIMREVMEQLDTPPEPSDESDLGVLVSDLDDPLADCVLRLIRMLRIPGAIPVLYPSIMREICFWLLTGPNGSNVCKLVLPESHTQRVARAIHLLRDRFTQPLRIEQLASAARMSPSSFHQHFKTLTSMTPLQYQKQLRLLEARRLMVSEAASVATAAYQVGYESVSQFSREYSRMFGTPPRRDVIELKSTFA